MKYSDRIKYFGAASTTAATTTATSAATPARQGQFEQELYFALSLVLIRAISRDYIH